ncbi:MAG: efflux transporter outer membrane subunit [Methylococcaceae bacterium]|nr:efflux transporter outer membrane subunit [Methylococcaceae bacterium]
MPRLFISLLATLVISGCVTTPNREKEQQPVKNLPTRWEAKPNTTLVPPSWLAGFNDPCLQNLVNESLTTNFDLQAAAARVEAAKASAKIAASGRFPQLFFSPGYERGETHAVGQSTDKISAFQALFDLNWELDVWGRIKDFSSASRLEAQATANDFRAARLSLAARTAQAYFKLTESNLQVKVAEESIKDRRTVVDLVRGRFNRGLTQGLDLRLALTDLTSAEAQLADSRNQVQLAARQLEVLLGRYPSGKAVNPAKLPNPPEPLQAGLPSEILQRRPDVAAAFERLKAADHRVASAQKALLPRVTLTASGGIRSSSLSEIIDPRAAAWNFLMGLSQPLFTGGRLSSEIDLQKAQVNEALNYYRQTALTAFSEVEQSLAAEEWLRRQEKALYANVLQTEESRKSAITAYRRGVIQILTLLDSYRSTLSAQSEYFAVQRQLLNNRINLYLALGADV